MVGKTKYCSYVVHELHAACSQIDNISLGWVILTLQRHIVCTLASFHAFNSSLELMMSSDLNKSIKLLALMLSDPLLSKHLHVNDVIFM